MQSFFYSFFLCIVNDSVVVNCLESCFSDSSALGVLLQSSLSLKENSILLENRKKTQMASEEKDVFS